jgi:DNA mismatch repair protein MutL
MLDHAVANAYGEILPKGSFPFFALFMSLDPEHVDVNVHPTKAEVKFDDDRGMYGFVLAVVRKALGESDIRPSAGFDSRGRLYERGSSPAAHARGAGDSSRDAPDGWERDLAGSWPMGRRQGDPGQRQIFGGRGDQFASVLYGEEAVPDRSRQAVTIEASTEKAGDSVGDARIWQLHEKYILARIRSGLMIVDQHAAHERILYERALNAMQDGLGMTQQLLFPQVVEFEAGDFELVRELMPDLRGLGFDVDTMSGRSVIIRGVPADIRVGNERSILDELVQQYKEFRDTLSLTGRDNIAASLACKTAIKTGQKLALDEMQSLIDQLFMCKMPYACPHGRPTMVKISLEELDRRFGRAGHLERN